MDEIEKAEQRYINIIRKFTTCELLEYFSKKSIEAYQNGKKGFTICDVPYYNKNGLKGIVKGFCYGQWELVQICYNSIRFSNDYRGKTVDESDYFNLLNENKIYDETIEVVDEDALKLFEHMQCLSNIQFDFQTLNTVTKFNRMYQILVTINKNTKYNQTEEVCYIDIEKEFKKITNIQLNKFIDIYFFLILLSSTRKNTNIFDIIKDLEFDVSKLGFSKDDIVNVIELLSKDYEFYKNTDNWNLLRFYPIVKTNKGENNYIITNIFSLMLSFPESIYWIIRNHYCELNCSDFTTYFGNSFEYYVQEIFEFYKINCQKLKVSKKQSIQMPDWKVETDKYIFLIEQKSSLFPIDTRTSSKKERFEKLEQYFNKSLVKGFNQLNSFKIDNTQKTIIRICLTFEKIYMEENAKRIIEEKMTFSSDINLNWIVNIDEFEILMKILSENEEEFNKIIEKRIYLEVTEDKTGRNFEKLLAGHKYDYANKVLNHFNFLGDNLKNKLKNV